MKKEKVLLVVGLFLVLIVGLGATYAYFNYTGDVGEVYLEAGDNIVVDFKNDVNYIDVDSAYSISDETGMIYPYYLDFEVTGTTSEFPVAYEIQLVLDTSNTINSNYVKVYLTDQNDVALQGPISYSLFEIALK